MDRHEADAYVDLALGLTTALYALLLDYNKQHARHKMDPDLTFLTVGLGCALCLAAAALRVRLIGETDRAATERSVWRAFLVGGGVIAVWQIGRIITRHMRRESTLRHYIQATEDLHAPQDHRQRPPERVAPLRWPGPSTN